MLNGTSTPAPTFKVTAYAHCGDYNYSASREEAVAQARAIAKAQTIPTSVGVTADFATLDEATRYAAQFPKSYGVKVWEVCNADFTRTAAVGFHIGFTPDNVNKGINERGLSRLRKMLGRVDWVWFEHNCLNMMDETNFRMFLREAK